MRNYMNVEKEKILIIMVNYNNSNDTLECVNSIRKNSELNPDILIVDNDSCEEDKLNLRKLEKDALIIFNDKNVGFALANNIGIEYGLEKEYSYFLLLNNDTIISKNSLEKMLEEIKSDEKCGMITCSTLYYDNKEMIWFDGGKINWRTYIPTHDNMGKKYKSKNESLSVDFISGCCMLIKKDVFKRVGLLPIEYFMYFEDADFCVKVKEAGYDIKVLKNCTIYHKVSSASGGEDSCFTIEYINKNRLKFMKKYKYKSKNNFEFFKSIIFYFVGRVIRSFQFIFKGKLKHAFAIYKGMFKGILEVVNNQ